jgi:hypothetical protein
VQLVKVERMEALAVLRRERDGRNGLALPWQRLWRTASTAGLLLGSGERGGAERALGQAIKARGTVGVATVPRRR